MKTIHSIPSGLVSWGITPSLASLRSSLLSLSLQSDWDLVYSFVTFLSPPRGISCILSHGSSGPLNQSIHNRMVAPLLHFSLSSTVFPVLCHLLSSPFPPALLPFLLSDTSSAIGISLVIPFFQPSPSPIRSLYFCHPVSSSIPSVGDSCIFRMDGIIL